jgi:histone acetyltransferase MYST1
MPPTITNAVGKGGKDQTRDVGSTNTGAGATLDSAPFTDALCVGEVVVAYLPTHGKWKKAVVVDIRRKRSSQGILSSILGHDAFGSDSNTLLKTEEDVEGPESFDYYVRYQDMNRRHDRWISWNDIRLISDEDSGKSEDDEEGEEEEEEEEDEDEEEEDDVGYSRRSTRRGSLQSKRMKKEEDDEEEEKYDEEDEEASELEYSDESDHEGMNENDIIEWEKATKVKRIDKIFIGESVMETWYWSPFPTDFQDCSLLYICEYCLGFFREKPEFQWHIANCKYRHPPGDEIYADPTSNPRMSVFEVDGFFERVYCENLCYLSKLFLDHKRFDRFDVSNFYFYIIGEWLGDDSSSSRGFRFIGYFSKEKQSTNRNLSCIMSLPCYQRRGFGSFIIEFSYEISKVAKKMGTPERPLSDLGKRTYLRWWLQRILRVIIDRTDPISITELSRITYIMPEDIKATLEEYKLLYYYKGQYHIAIPPDRLKALWVDDNPNHVKVNPLFIHWTPLELPVDPSAEL